jgi:hypothetical protein
VGEKSRRVNQEKDEVMLRQVERKERQGGDTEGG